MASSSSYNSPCAACKFLRRKCLPGCIFSPYFPPEEPQKFINVHKIFGASNVTKLLNELLPHQREDAVNSLAYEAEARVRDPVYGCVGAISFLQRQVERLQKELDAANADLIRYACNDFTSSSVPPLPVHHNTILRQRSVEFTRRQSFGHHNHDVGGDGGGGGGGGGGFYQTSSYPIPYSYPNWNDHQNSTGDHHQHIHGGGGGSI